MKTLIIEHDNGVSGQVGFSEHIVENESDAKCVISDYENKGIFIYSIKLY